MRNTSIQLTALTLALTAFLALTGTPAAAGDRAVNEVIVLSPGESQQRQFFLPGVISLPSLKPLIGYVVIATARGDELAGALSISLSVDADIELGATMDYALAGINYSLDADPGVIYESATTPFSISTSVSIDSTFGFVYAGALITDVSSRNDVSLPALFTVKFSLAAAAAAAE